MRATRGKKKRARASSETHPEPPATQRIGILNRKQARVKFTDPYSGGVSSGRAAKPDAQSAANNAETRARAAAAVNSAGVSQQQQLPSTCSPAPNAICSPAPFTISCTPCMVHRYDTIFHSRVAPHSRPIPAHSLYLPLLALHIFPPLGPLSSLNLNTVL